MTLSGLYNSTEEVNLTDRIPKNNPSSTQNRQRGDPSCRKCGDGLAGEGVGSQQDSALGAYHYPQIETKERLRAQRVSGSGDETAASARLDHTHMHKQVSVVQSHMRSGEL